MGSTQRRSYREHTVAGKAGTQCERILGLLEASELPLSRHQIERLTGIPLASVCGRVYALIDSGLVAVARVDEDPQTRHRVEYLTRAGGQLPLFAGFMPGVSGGKG